MKSLSLFLAAAAVLFGLPFASSVCNGADFTVDERDDRLVITHGDQPVAEYVFADPKILRSYFANLHAPGGVRVSRNHPPVAGQDDTDHEAMHPGVWLGFGDLSGIDFWRNQARIEQVRFSEPPKISKGKLDFVSEAELSKPDGKKLCDLTSRCTLSERPGAFLLTWEATLRSTETDFTFGDQEEMGFGGRVATELTEKNGGQLLNSEGLKSADKTWGQAAAWCDYAKVVEGKARGITLLADPANFRPSWWHNRNYGLFVANPFGRAALKQGEKSTVTVKRGEPFRICFGAVLHNSADYDPAAEFENFVKSVK